MFNKARSIRNNNPGNIREAKGGGIAWEGERATDNDAAFEEFTTPDMGIRAMNKIFKSYYLRYGLDTVRGIVGRWAPSSENNTESYIAAVARALSVTPDQKIDVQARAIDLTRAIIKHENGVQPYDMATIQNGVALGWA